MAVTNEDRESGKASQRVRKIAIEEYFLIPEFVTAVNKFMASPRGDEEPGLDWWKKGYFVDPDSLLGRRSFDFEFRLEEMDKDGVDMQVLHFCAPGAQIFDAQEAIELTRLANDRVAAAVRRHPTRFQAYAAVAPQDPQASIVELERCIKGLGFKGVLINSYTKGHYLDEPQFRPLLRKIAELDVPLYIHPREPSAEQLAPYRPYALSGSMWGFAADAGLHGMRMILGGIFDELPNLKMILGHGGEGIPYFLDRIDNRMNSPTKRANVPKLAHKPSHYMRNNLWVTSSGLNWEPAVKFCQQVLGEDRVLLAIDYPMEEQAWTVKRVDDMQMPIATKELFCSGNATRLLRL